ncbi:unnamed protein product [Adineta steineri]|uniref:Uncharacterized protein n=1 Tax=Adineta steineri TaxID=433720 RepID=A0A819CMD5_9BILA|nr:unnamed protein product [Adineta steineri]CAF3817850.1 unnamed protein product [Adineta steineri]
MPSISKRNTRSNTNLNPEISSNMSISTSSTNESIDEQVPRKRARTYRQITNKKQSAMAPDTDVLINEIIQNQPNESTNASPKFIALGACDNIEDSPTSPRPLVIEVTEDIVCSRFDSNRAVHNFSRENFNPPRTPLAHKKANNTSKDITHSFSNEGCAGNISQKESSTISKTTSGNTNTRTPMVGRNMSTSFSQASNRAVVVSTDQIQRNSNEENIYNHRTSTPYPSRPEQVNTTTQGASNDSSFLESIPPQTREVLWRFPEFRRLIKLFKNEQIKSKTWMNDYARLKKNYDRLEKNSFPRPSAPALNFLTDLVAHIQHSNDDRDPRSDEQLATDLGVSRAILIGLKYHTPQQAALNLFNYFYSSCVEKTNLRSINNLEVLKPGLLQDILVFAQRAAPGVGYGIIDLRETLGNCIRGARYQFRKKNGSISDAAAFLENDNTDRNDFQNDESQNTSHSDPTNIDINGKYGSSAFDDNE